MLIPAEDATFDGSAVGSVMVSRPSLAALFYEALTCVRSSLAFREYIPAKTSRLPRGIEAAERRAALAGVFATGISTLLCGTAPAVDPIRSSW